MIMINTAVRRNHGPRYHFKETHWCTKASLTTIWVASSRSRTLPLGWWRALGDVTSSCQFSASWNGFQCGSASSSRSPPSSTRRRLGTVADDCCLVSDAPRPTRLHTADTRKLPVSRTRTNFGDRAFSAAWPPVWNYLSTDRRQPDVSNGRFRQSLKTFYLVSGTKALF